MPLFFCVRPSNRLSGERNSPNFFLLLFSLSLSSPRRDLPPSLPEADCDLSHKMEMKPPRIPSRVKLRDKHIVQHFLPSLSFVPLPPRPDLPPFLEPPYLTKQSIDLSPEERPPPPYSCDLEEGETSNSSGWKKVGRTLRLLLCGACESNIRSHLIITDHSQLQIARESVPTPNFPPFATPFLYPLYLFLPLSPTLLLLAVYSFSRQSIKQSQIVSRVY